MAVQGEITQNENVKGLFTEGSPLNYPEGATVRDENFILNPNGSRERRLGLGYEPSAQTNLTNPFPGDAHVFDWDAVGNDGSLNFAVVMTQGSISFYDKSKEPLSEGFLQKFTVYYTIGEQQVSGTVINGDLVVVGMQRAGGSPINGAGPQDITVFNYSTSTQSIETTSYSLKVRDIWGVDDPLDIDQRSNTLTPQHAYNIANQGWKRALAQQVRAVGVTTETVTVVIPGNDGPGSDTTESQTVVIDKGGWPSNADLVTYGISEADEDDRFKEKLYSVVPFGTTPAPKGACIVNLTNMGDNRESFANKYGYSAYTDKDFYSDLTEASPKAVASYAGRVFYAGFTNTGRAVNDTYPNLTGTVVFSRSVETQGDVAKCYQQADPTTLDPEIVASDGGTLGIAGSGFIYKLVPAGRSLLVFASQGVWEIYSTDQLFSATNYQVRKLTDVGCKAAKSVIVVEGMPMYWTDYGIYALQADQVSESYAPTNITAGTIQTYYDSIDANSARYASGFYDQFDKKARWLWSSDAERPSAYDRELILDSRLQSWYTNVYPYLPDEEIAGMVSLNAYSEISVQSNVVVGEDSVIAGSDNVVLDQAIPEKGKRSYKYVVKKYDITDLQFMEHNRGDFQDFGLYDATALMITGPYTGGDSVRRKNSSYLTVHMSKTETGYVFDGGDLVPENPSSCLIQTQWDWTNLAKAGKFNAPIEMYRHKRHYFPVSPADQFEDGNTVVTTKSRLRGSGKALTLKIQSSPGKDLNLLGYNIQVTQSEKV